MKILDISEITQPYGGFPDGVEVVDSRVTLPELPGIADLNAQMKALAA